MQTGRQLMTRSVSSGLFRGEYVPWRFLGGWCALTNFRGTRFADESWRLGAGRPDRAGWPASARPKFESAAGSAQYRLN